MQCAGLAEAAFFFFLDLLNKVALLFCVLRFKLFARLNYSLPFKKRRLKIAIEELDQAFRFFTRKTAGSEW